MRVKPRHSVVARARSTLAVVRSGSNPDEEQAVIEVLVDARRSGLNRGTSGNASYRAEPGFVITPSAMPYDKMQSRDLVAIDADGIASGLHRPSSEWLFHQRIYQRRNDVDAIVHLHSPAATAVSTLRLDIPPFHYMVAVAGGTDIRCSDYATFGTPELAEAAIMALAERSACLLANHGLIACGPSVFAAYNLAVEVESLAQQYLLARAVDRPTLLSAEQMEEVLDKYADYRPDI
ncbi:MAG: class II aldolase/adducin family protein [Acidimicrobiia bacterium]|nr:class II aldolase/adducin family protein [Acidimicrobiia bacterium]